MIGYASVTGTLRNMEALRLAGWRALVAPSRPAVPRNIRHALDNGAWSAFQSCTAFDTPAFERLLVRAAAGADWIVAPDIVAGGLASLSLSAAWLPRLTTLGRPLLAVQDGMTLSDVQPILRDFPTAGVFLGGSTEWKLAKMHLWGEFTKGHQRYYHVGRVNTARRIAMCEEAGADSFDGTSATRFSKTLPLLEWARTRRSLFRVGQ